MTTWTVLNLIGWVSLIVSWVTPLLMKKDNADKHFVGAVLAAFACGLFVSGLIVSIMK